MKKSCQLSKGLTYLIVLKTKMIVAGHKLSFSILVREWRQVNQVIGLLALKKLGRRGERGASK